MPTVNQLLKDLREYVKESKDPDLAGFYHDVGNGAHIAAAFDDLDALITKTKQLPKDWQESNR